MSEKKILVPFDWDLYYKVSNHTIRGRLVSRGGQYAKIEMTDKEGKMLCSYQGRHSTRWLHSNGMCLLTEDSDVDLLIELEEPLPSKFSTPIKEQAIKYAVDLIKPLPLQGGCGSCWSCDDKRSPEEKHQDSLRFNQELMDQQRKQVILMAKEIEKFLSE